MPCVLAISNLLIICEQVLVSSFRQNTHRKPHPKGWGSSLINGINNIRLVYEENKNNPKIRWKDSIRDLLKLGAMTGPGAASRDGGDATKPEENGN